MPSEQVKISDISVVTPTLDDKVELAHTTNSGESYSTGASTVQGLVDIAQANTSAKNMAQEYDDTETYNTGDIVIYNNTLYQALDDSITGEWDSTDWEEVNLVDVLQDTAQDIQDTIQDVVQDITSDINSLALNSLVDVDITSPEDKQAVVYNASTEKWENAVFGRVLAYGKLTAGSTSVTITNPNIHADSTLEFYANKKDFPNPDTITFSGTSVTLTFPAQTTDTMIKVVINNETDPVIYDYEIYDQALNRSWYADTGIDLSGDNNSRDFEIITIVDASAGFWGGIFSAANSAEGFFGWARWDNMRMLAYPFGRIEFENSDDPAAHTYKMRVTRTNGTVRFYVQDSTIPIASGSWPGNSGINTNLIIGRRSNLSHPVGPGTLREFKFRWL